MNTLVLTELKHMKAVTRSSLYLSHLTTKVLKGAS